MLAAFGANGQFQKTVCGKRGYNAVVKAQRQIEAAPSSKKRIPWHNDGPNASVSSLSVLIKWMTDGNNYNRCKGGDGQCGETKQTLASEVVAAIAASGVKTARSPKYVMNKILGLESSLRSASDWLNNTGQGVHNEAGIRAAILHRCPTYFELQPIMDDSPSTHPLLLNTQPGFTYSYNGSESASSGDDEDNDSAERNLERAPQNAQTDSLSSANVSTTPSLVSSKSGRAATSNLRQQPGKRGGGTLTTIVGGESRAKNSRNSLADTAILVALKEDQLAHQKEI
ncbi:hypothetical protein PF008_g13795 [Phytophthora fragariae]|uniref:Uncharacterized protein n=1 Tax=Phytophthora fragariae TaxID=53985 RepID=A0A6G0RJ13_9STRA|nr:hypothetical protein PF008_g13795 [Phytophthora fragariae]